MHARSACVTRSDGTSYRARCQGIPVMPACNYTHTHGVDDCVVAITAGFHIVCTAVSRVQQLLRCCGCCRLCAASERATQYNYQHTHKSTHTHTHPFGRILRRCASRRQRKTIHSTRAVFVCLCAYANVIIRGATKR